MSITSKPIDPYLAQALSTKSDEELLGILKNPADWRPEVVDFARSELGRRSVSTAQIEEKLAEKAEQSAEEFQKRATVPLTFWESAFSVLYGAALGLLGLFFIWPQASRFKSDGYTLKSQRSWRLYWFTFGVRVAALLILIIIAVVTSH